MTGLLEEWRSIPDWPNYQVSNLGRVKRLACRGARKNLPERLLKITINKIYGKRKDKSSFYAQTCVSLGIEHSTLCSVAILVLRTFVGEPEEGQVSRHLDDVSTNCILSNLAWGTQKQNIEDAMRNGKTRKGTQINTTKLTENQVREIRNLYIPRHKEYSQHALAKKFKVHQATINEILTRKSWRHI